MEYEFQEKFKRIGLKVAYYRKMQNMTQAQLAERLDVDTSYIGAIESVKMYKPISLKTLFRIAEALQISPSKLLEE